MFDPTQIAVWAAAGLPLEALLERTFMPKISNSTVKAAVPLVSGLVAATSADMLQNGTPWQVALMNAAGPAVAMAATAMAVHGTAVGSPKMVSTVAPDEPASAPSAPPVTPVQTPVTPVQTPVTPVQTPVTPVQTPVTPVQTPATPVQTPATLFRTPR